MTELKTKVVTMDELEAKADPVYVICVRKEDVDTRLRGRMVEGSREGVCSDCGDDIIYAPSAPKNGKLICSRCGEIMIMAQARKNDGMIEICVSQKSIDEANKELAKDGKKFVRKVVQ